MVFNFNANSQSKNEVSRTEETHHNHTKTSFHLYVLVEHISSLVLTCNKTFDTMAQTVNTFNIKFLLQLTEQCTYQSAPQIQFTSYLLYIDRIDNFVTITYTVLLHVSATNLFLKSKYFEKPIKQPGTIVYCRTENKYFIALHRKRLNSKSVAIDYLNLHLIAV